MPEPKPTLNRGESCLYFDQRDGDVSTGMMAFVLEYSPDGVLGLEVHHFSAGTIHTFYRRSVYHKNDPRLRDHPQQGRYCGGTMGGVWDYIEPAPRSGRAAYPAPMEETVPVPVPAPKIPSVVATNPPKQPPQRSPLEIEEKLAAMAKAGLKAADAAEVMRNWTGDPDWNHQLIGKRWAAMKEEVVG